MAAAPLDEGEVLLRGAFQAFLLTPAWRLVKEKVALDLNTWRPTEELASPRDSPRKGNESTVREQLMLDLVGEEMRNMWGKQEEYKPELLREPYLQKALRATMSRNLLAQLLVHIDTLTKTPQISSQFQLEAKGIFESLLHHEKKTLEKQQGVLFEKVGQALVSTLRNEDLVVRLLSSSASGTGGGDSDGASPAASTLLAEDANAQEVQDIVDGFSASAIEEACSNLKGSFLSDSLRFIIWSHRYLTRR